MSCHGAEIITKELLEKVLSGSCQTLTIKNFEVSPGSDLGDNFASIVLKVTVDTVENGTELKRHLIVKTLPNDANVRQAILKRAKTFQKESFTFCELFPKLLEVKKSRGVDSDDLPVPKCYYTNVDDDNGIVVLEDLRPSGYKLDDVRKGLDFDHCKVTMHEIAKFHACTFALKKTLGGVEGLKKEYPLIFTETLMSSFQQSMLMPIMEKMNGVIVDIIISGTNRDDVKAKARHLNMKTSMEKAATILKEPEEQFALFCHGDFWANNVMFRYSEEGRPIQAKMFDFQATRYATLTTDLVYFIFLSTNKSVRQNHLDELLTAYHAQFHASLKSMGLTFPELTMEKLTSLFYKTAWLGIGPACGFLVALFSKLATEDKPAVNMAAGDTELDVDSMLESVSSPQAMKERIAGLFENAVDFGLV